MTQVTLPCYVKIQGDESDESVEIPTEDDGTLLLTTVTSQFPGAVGLRFKGESGTWRGVRLNENVLKAPLEGWGDTVFCVVMPKKGEKRKAIDDDEDLSPLEKMSKMTEKEILSDLVVLNLPFKATEADVKAHFQQYGDLDMCEIKYDNDRKSRGFGFIRYKTVEAVKAVFEAKHILEGRELDVYFPKDKTLDDGTPNKLFIGRLPKDLKVEELREHFEKCGAIKDVRIPTPFRGYGFVSFKKQSDARKVLATTHVIKGQYVNVAHPVKKQDPTENKVNNGNTGYEWNPAFGNQGFGNQGFENQGFRNQRFSNQSYGNMQGMQGQMQKGMQGMLPRGMPPQGHPGMQQSGLRNFGYSSYGSRQ